MPGASETIGRLHPSLVHHIVNTLGWPGLRPLQAAAIGPVLDGDDALLLAPTAGGKTEAAAFPLFSQIASGGGSGTGLQALYICPLKALLNNLQPRLDSYASWLGLRVALWHGDLGASGRKAIIANPPQILLATPESLEAMLISAKSDHNRIFESLHTVVIDEVHAFAGDDRGWHLLAVTERLARVAGRRLQRIGLSATVGNPEELLAWLQGSNKGQVPARVIAPHLAAAQLSAAPDAQIELDYVGSVANAAKVIATLHRGEKRLVFCESRRLVEELGEALRGVGVTTYLSHASLSADERRRAEAAFADARDCVIVATSTLELGIDVGDLDRVIQIDSPGTVASFLQRIGRSGRRSGTVRNYLFLTLHDETLVQAAGLLHLWGQGWVEPVTAPPEPRHLVAQQILALCRQEHRIGDKLWAEGWNGLPPFGAGAEPILRHLIAEGFLESDGGMLFIGEQAEKRFGHRHFMDMTAAFTSPPQFTVLSGRSEIGRTDPTLLTEACDGPRRLLLAGRSWQVTYIDWKRHRCFVEPVDGGGKAKWQAAGGGGISYHLARAIRAVLLGADPPVALTRRSKDCLSAIRNDSADIVHPSGTVLTRSPGGDVQWWTFAGHKTNATLTATLAGLAADRVQRHTDQHIRLRSDITPVMWSEARGDAALQICLPDIDPRATAGLKFSAALPERLATATLAARLAATDTAGAVLAEPARWYVS